MPYLLKRLLKGDGALIELRSHWDTNFLSGRKLANRIETPVKFEIDIDSEGRRMPTLFTIPALVARPSFCDILCSGGVDNVEQIPASIRNPETGEIFDEYLILNIVGIVAGADLLANPGVELGPGIRVIDDPVLRRAAIRDLLIFRLAEDPVQIVVSDSVASRIRISGLDDIYLETLAVT